MTTSTHPSCWRSASGSSRSTPARCWPTPGTPSSTTREGCSARFPTSSDTDDPDPAVRLRSLLRTPGGNDFYGVIRTEVLRRIGPHRGYYNADRTFMASLVVRGRFRQVPEVLYHRRDHPGRATRAGSPRDRAAVLDPRRASPLRHVLPVMYAEYVGGMVKAVLRAPISPRDQVRCLGEVGSWLVDTAVTGRRARSLDEELDTA